MHADSRAARLGWPERRAKASAGRRTVDGPRCGAAFQGAFKGGRTKIEGGRTSIEGGRSATVCRFS